MWPRAHPTSIRRSSTGNRRRHCSQAPTASTTSDISCPRPRHTWSPAAGWSWRSVPARGLRCGSCSSRPATARWRSARTWPGTIASPSAGAADDGRRQPTTAGVSPPRPASAEPDGDVGEDGALLRRHLPVDARDVAGGREQCRTQHTGADAPIDRVEELDHALTFDGSAGFLDRRAEVLLERLVVTPLVADLAHEVDLVR